MGIHDRGYYRDDPPPGFEVGWNGKSPISIIIIICIVCFVANLFRITPDARLTDLAALHASDLWKPWMWWRVLTYGFVHSSAGPGHLFFNMLSLWMLGRAVEERYGWREFWRIYLFSVVFCGIVFLGIHNLTDRNSSVVGASGAVLAVTMLFVFNYPKNTILLFGIVPMPAWALGLVIVLMNLLFLPNSQDRVAYDVHLAGIAFAAMYFYGNWNFNFLENLFSRFRFARRKTFGPRLKTYNGDDDSADKDAIEADRILEKIQQSGMDSLSSRERKFMERYSKKVRERQHG